MLGLLWTPKELSPRIESGRSASLYPVAGAPVVERTAAAMASAGVDELVLVADAADVREWGETNEFVGVVTDNLSVAGKQARGERGPVVVARATSLLDSETVPRLASACPAVATSSGVVDGSVPAAFAVPAAAVADAESVEGLANASDDTNRERVESSLGYDVRRPWELLEATETVLDAQSRSLEGAVHETAECRGAVVVEPGAVVEAGTVVEGPTLVSRGCTVGPNAYVRGRTFLAREAHIGHAVEVKNSVLLEDARAPHLTYVGDSVVGPGANLGAGTQIANLRHDDRAVAVAHDHDRVSTERRKFGAVVGGGAKLGIGTRLDAGVTVGPSTTTGPGEVLTRDKGV